MRSCAPLWDGGGTANSPIMSDSLKIASAQTNSVVGDIAGNAARIRAARKRAAEAGADIVAFPEMTLLGYPPEDLVQKPSAVAECEAYAKLLVSETGDGGPAILFGTPWRRGDKLHNAAILADAGDIAGMHFKVRLPNYGIFDEERVFDEGPSPEPFEFRGHLVGAPICEDLWVEGVARTLKERGATLLFSPNGSPWRRTITLERKEAICDRLEAAGLPIIYVNQIGGQDELVFDGGSFSLNGEGEFVQILNNFEEDFDLATWTRKGEAWTCKSARVATPSEGEEAEWRAMMLGLSDYIDKNGFPGVLIGLSGGIDSAISAAVAVDALGPDRVHCVMMPSKFTSQASLDDAAEAAQAMGCRLDTIPINPAVETVDHMLDPFFADHSRDTTEENIQSRLRGLLLMALSNKFGKMVLTTGNKSEVAVGYATLYGDMCGGFNVLKDLYKTEVFKLARWRNTALPRGAKGNEGEVIPKAIIDKPPTAELRPDQKDEDSLPPYEVLDDILYSLVEREEDVDDIVARGYDAETVRKVEHLLYIAEYKRRQAAPGIKIGTKIFGRDRRYPITNKYRDKPDPEIPEV